MLFCFFKQKTAYEMRISDWSSDVCSSDLVSVKPTRGQALGNTLWQTGKSITWTGSAFAVRDNMRFKTQWAGSITTTAGSAYTIPTATMALGSGSAAAELVQATYVGTDPYYQVSAHIHAGPGESRLGDEASALVAGTREEERHGGE